MEETLAPNLAMWILFFFFLLIPFSLSAEEPPLELPPITIEENSRPVDTNTHQEFLIQDHRNRSQSLSEILSGAAGFHLKRFGIAGQDSLSIRGSDPNEVLVFLDGIPLQTSSGQGVDLSLYSLESLESLSIDRGASQLSIFSPPGGFVSLQSKKIKEGKNYGVSLGYGSWDTLKTSGFYSQGGPRFSFLLVQNYSRTDGNFSFLDDRGTPINKADDRVTQRQNNSLEMYQPFFKGVYQFDDRTSAEGILQWTHRESGVPGVSQNQSKTANLTTNDLLMGLTLKRQGFFHPDLNWKNTIYFRWSKYQFSDPFGEIGLGAAQDNDEDTVIFGNRMTFDFALGNFQKIELSQLFQVESYRPEDFAVTPSQGGTSRRLSYNIGLMDTFHFFQDRLKVVPVVRLENLWNHINNEDPSFLTPATFQDESTDHAFSGGFTIEGKVTSFLTLSAHGGRSLRFPSFPELFGDRGGVVGNPFLKPQKSFDFDFGFLLKTEPVQLTTSIFDRSITDLIQFEQGTGFARAENIGKARIQGLEVGTEISFLKYFLFEGAYTYQKAIDHSTYDGLNLPGRPRHELSTTLHFQADWAQFFVSALWMDQNFLDPLNTRLVHDRFFVDAGLSVPAWKYWIFSIEAKNIMNDQVVDVLGFPLPGRSFFAKIRWER